MSGLASSIGASPAKVLQFKSEEVSCTQEEGRVAVRLNEEGLHSMLQQLGCFPSQDFPVARSLLDREMTLAKPEERASVAKQVFDKIAVDRFPLPENFNDLSKESQMAINWTRYLATIVKNNVNSISTEIEYLERDSGQKSLLFLFEKYEIMKNYTYKDHFDAIEAFLKAIQEDLPALKEYLKDIDYCGCSIAAHHDISLWEQNDFLRYCSTVTAIHPTRLAEYVLRFVNGKTHTLKDLLSATSH